MRRYGEPIKDDIRYRHRPGAYAILMREGQVLLTHQTFPAPEYQLPGGGVEAGEHILPALHREIMEETGWRATGLVRVGAYRRFTYMAEYDLWAEKVCLIYAGRPTLRLSCQLEPSHRVVWCHVDEACAHLSNDGDRAIFDEVIRHF